MSTEIGKLADEGVYLTRFWGGAEDGTSLQITVDEKHSGFGYVQLNRKQVAWLKKTLKGWIDRVEE